MSRAMSKKLVSSFKRRPRTRHVNCHRGVKPERFSKKTADGTPENPLAEAASTETLVKHIFVRHMDTWLGLTLRNERDFVNLLFGMQILGLVAEETWQLEESAKGLAKVKSGRWLRHSSVSSGLFSGSTDEKKAEESEECAKDYELKGGLVVWHYSALLDGCQYRAVHYNVLDEWRPLLRDSHPSEVDVTYVFGEQLAVYRQYYEEYGDFDVPDAFHMSHLTSAVEQLTEVQLASVRPVDYRMFAAAKDSAVIGSALKSAATDEAIYGSGEQADGSQLADASKEVAIRVSTRWLRLRFANAEEFDRFIHDTQSIGLVEEDSQEIMRSFEQLEGDKNYRLQPWTVDAFTSLFQGDAVAHWFHSVAERKRDILRKREKDAGKGKYTESRGASAGGKKKKKSGGASSSSAWFGFSSKSS